MSEAPEFGITPYDPSVYITTPEEAVIFLRETAELINDSGALKSVMRAAAKALDAMARS